jgi:DNA-binding beta-propeller fold protein YncE
MSTSDSSRYVRHFVGAAVLTVVAAGAVSAQVRILQTNSRGGNIHLIDPATNTIVGEITGVPINHGAAAAPDGRTLWVTSRPNARVYTYSLPDLKLLPGFMDLGGRADWLTFTPDSRQVYIATENTDTTVVIDAAARNPVVVNNRMARGSWGPVSGVFPSRPG